MRTRSKQVTVEKFIAKMVADGKLSFGAYYDLFIKSSEPWSLVKYYLLADVESFEGLCHMAQGHDNDEYKDRVIATCRAVYDSYVSRKGSVRFKREVLQGLAHGDIDCGWLRRQFNILAEESEGSFNIEENWKALGLYEDEDNIFNLLYLLRLLFESFHQGVEIQHENI